jgi:hypothetical protein
MSITFETLSGDQIRSMDDLANSLAFEAMEPPVLEESAVRYVMPYFAAMRTYERHVDSCSACQNSPIWDIGCEEGAALAHIAADAMAAQDDLATQN